MNTGENLNPGRPTSVPEGLGETLGEFLGVVLVVPKGVGFYCRVSKIEEPVENSTDGLF